LECQVVEFNGEGDHVHLLVSHPTKISVAELSRLLKGVSARLLRKEFWSHIKTMLWGDHFWSPSYCAVSAGGAPLAIIQRYIEDQNRPTTAAQLKTSKAAQARWKTHQLR
jgi:putative transposase